MTEKSRVIWVSLVLLAAVALLLAGCSNSGQERKLLPKDLAVQKAQLRISMESTVGNIDTLVDTLQQRASGATRPIAQEYQSKIDSLNNWKAEINKRMNAIENITAENWGPFEADARGFINRIDEKVNRMKP
jgi:hypothetical protein